MKNLVIVESPTKSHTISKYLGKDFIVLASYGHVVDLLHNINAVDTKNNFKTKFEIIKKNINYINKIKNIAKTVENIYLATDPDREGEAIAYNICNILEENGLDENIKIHRISFNEITITAVKAAISNPKKISMNLVNAQKTRRILDFLVGFHLSPLLWKKINKGLSAGRVQSPALKMIVERENEIEKFLPKEFWNCTVHIKNNNLTIEIIVDFYSNNKINKFYINTEEEAEKILQYLLKISKGFIDVKNISKKLKNFSSLPPFTTSSLQQEAIKKLYFTSKKTMLIAQKLYEGVKISNNKTIGIITYMRTDSTNIAKDFILNIRKFIKIKFGEEYLSEKVKIYTKKTKNAQEAHEAIRPSDITLEPQNIKQYLTIDQYKLYNIIWKRTIKSQMTNAIQQHSTISFGMFENKYHIKYNENYYLKLGYLIAEQEEKSFTFNSKQKFETGQKFKIEKISKSQHFTKPLPRYNEASLIKTLEEYGIGRPSTYTNIIGTLLNRKYTLIKNKTILPTTIGKIVNNFLNNYFHQYIEYNFTATVESKLDDIAIGKIKYLEFLKNFWKPFNETIKQVDSNISKKDAASLQMNDKCPKCSSLLNIKLSTNGSFIGCSNYPKCDFTKNIFENHEKILLQKFNKDENCPSCADKLLIKKSKYGIFIGCSSYPNCRYVKSLKEPEDIGVKCNKCTKNNFVKIKSKKGKIFYSCANYPKCDNSFWHMPSNDKCPKCSNMILYHNSNKLQQYKICSYSKCNFKLKD